MIEIEKPRIEAQDLASNGTYGKFVVEPLERGYGTTPGKQSAPRAAVLPARRGGHFGENRRDPA